MKLSAYLKLFKFRYHLSFLLVVIGAYLFYDKPFYFLLPSLLRLYIVFNILIYGGLYMLNDIIDIENDRKHPQKKERPLASNIISLREAFVFASICIVTGLILSYIYFSIMIFSLLCLFILVNIFYTNFAKKIPYVEIAFNAITHPMRLLLGISLTTTIIPVLFLGEVFLLALSIATLRRSVELQTSEFEARLVLRHYTGISLFILQIMIGIFIILISIIIYPQFLWWNTIIIIIYCLSFIGIYWLKLVLRFYQWLWLR